MFPLLACVGVAAQQPTWVEHHVRGRAVLAADTGDPGILLARALRGGVCRSVVIRLDPSARRLIDVASLEAHASRALARLMPKTVSEQQVLAAVEANEECFVLRLEVVVDASADGTLVQAASAVRLLKPRVRPIGQVEDAYVDAEVYATPLTHFLSTAFLGDDPATNVVRVAIDESCRNLAKDLVAARKGRVDPVPAEEAYPSLDHGQRDKSEVINPRPNLIDPARLFTMMKQRGVVVIVEEFGQDPSTDPWSRARELSSDAVKGAVEARLQAAGIPLVGEIPSDRPLPFVVSCAFWIAQTDLSGTPLRRGALCGVTGDIAIREIVALDERAEHVVTSLGVWRGTTHQRLGRFPGIPTRQDLEGLLEPCVAACTAEVIATGRRRDPGATQLPAKDADAGGDRPPERGRRRR